MPAAVHWSLVKSRLCQPQDAFAINPVGPVPYSSYQAFGISLVVVFPLLSVTVCGLRVYSRRISSGLGVDDWLIFLAAALAQPHAIFSILYIRTGYWGLHDEDIPPHPPNQGLFCAYLTRVFHTPLLALVKISALLFILRLGRSKTSVRRFCKTLLLICTLQLIVFFPITVFKCRPIEKSWTSRGDGQCLSHGAVTVILACFNIATDIFTIVIPFVAFHDLKVPNKIRYALLAVFTLGGLVIVISILRLYFVIKAWYLPPGNDSRYSLGYTTNSIEVNLAIITASIPALWPLARAWFPRAFSSLGIDRPYLYPDIEVVYDTTPSSPIGTTRPTIHAIGEDGAVRVPKRAVLRGKIRWLQKRPGPPSFVRPAISVDESRHSANAIAGGSHEDKTEQPKQPFPEKQRPQPSDIRTYQKQQHQGGASLAGSAQEQQQHTSSSARVLSGEEGSSEDDGSVLNYDYHRFLRGSETETRH